MGFISNIGNGILGGFYKLKGNNKRLAITISIVTVGIAVTIIAYVITHGGNILSNNDGNIYIGTKIYNIDIVDDDDDHSNDMELVEKVTEQIEKIDEEGK